MTALILVDLRKIICSMLESWLHALATDMHHRFIEGKLIKVNQLQL
jgi:hypothetical protein